MEQSNLFQGNKGISTPRRASVVCVHVFHGLEDRSFVIMCKTVIHALYMFWFPMYFCVPRLYNHCSTSKNKSYIKLLVICENPTPCCQVWGPCYVGSVKPIWYLSPMRAAKVQARLRICAVSPEPLLLPHTSSESRGTFRLKVRSLAPLNGWACAVKICHDGMLEDTNLLDAAHVMQFAL